MDADAAVDARGLPQEQGGPRDEIVFDQRRFTAGQRHIIAIFERQRVMKTDGLDDAHDVVVGLSARQDFEDQVDLRVSVDGFDRSHGSILDSSFHRCTHSSTDSVSGLLEGSMPALSSSSSTWPFSAWRPRHSEL